MRSQTVVAILDAPREEVFRYLADIEKLPEWSTEFAQRLKKEGDDYKVVGVEGEFYFSIKADPDSGVIDMYAGPEKDRLAIFPTRTVELPGGKTAYVFTMFQGPDQSDEVFDSAHESLQREFQNIRARFAS